MKTLLSLSLVTLLLFGLSGCNTISGAGRDVSATGRVVSNGANSVKSSMQN